MKEILCDITALKYHRTPPQALLLCPPMPRVETDRRRDRLRSNPMAAELLGLPLYLLVTSRNERACGATVRQRLFLGELPTGSIVEGLHGYDVVSPLMAVFTVSRRLSDLATLLLLSELCSSFSPCSLPERLERALEETVVDHPQLASMKWERCPATDKDEASLWRRPRLVSSEDLWRFCHEIAPYRGGKRFGNIARHVVQDAASPFEVEAALLIALPRNMGGEGMRIKGMNVKIVLSERAKRLVDSEAVYADILLESADGDIQVVLECQGKGTHGERGVNDSDAVRMTALQSMGYTVYLLTHDQISDEAKFSVTFKSICRDLDAPYYPKTPDEEEAERKLRGELFISWEKLGSINEPNGQDRTLRPQWRVVPDK